jgi:ABC-type enterochelin transport system ATPase subunit
MLKEKTYNSGDIVTVYLQTGQEILGKFVSEDDTTTIIKKPLTVAIGPQGAAFQTFTVTGDSENDVSFKTGKIISVLKTNDATSSSYIEATSSIITPDKGGIIQ